MKTVSNQSHKKRIRLANYICAGLAIVLIVLQFLPFWGCFQCSTCGEGKMISINEYVWFANNHKSGLTSVLKNYYIPDFKALDVVGTSVLIQLGALFAIALCILQPTKSSTALAPFIAGLSCVIGYLTQPAYQLGNLWQLHLTVGIVTLIASISVFVLNFWCGYCKAKAEILDEVS